MIDVIFLFVVAILVIVIMMWLEIRQLRVDLVNLEGAVDDLGAEMMLCVGKNSENIETKLEEVKDLQIDASCNVRGILDKLGGGYPFTRGS